jgi:hypothetical protein
MLHPCSRFMGLSACLATSLIAMSGCASTPQTSALPPPPPEQFSPTSKRGAGAQVAEIYGDCLRNANEACPGATVRCEAYRPSYVKSCLLKANVPPSYIAALGN